MSNRMPYWRGPIPVRGLKPLRRPVRTMLMGTAMQTQPPKAPEVNQDYLALVAATFRRKMDEDPRALVNPFSGDLIWVEGMHNCPPELFEQAARDLDVNTAEEMVDALLN